MPRRSGLHYRVKRHSVAQPLDKPYRLIPLTQGQNAIVNAGDFEWLSRWNWIALWSDTEQSYVVTRRGGIIMSRLILNSKPGEDADHKNHDTLDNRRENLRPCTQSQNSANRRKFSNNTSGFKGVSLNEGRWRGKITVQHKQIYLGYFSTAEEAAHAYDEAAKKFHGEFAHINFHL